MLVELSGAKLRRPLVRVLEFAEAKGADEAENCAVRTVCGVYVHHPRGPDGANKQTHKHKCTNSANKCNHKRAGCSAEGELGGARES